MDIREQGKEPGNVYNFEKYFDELYVEPFALINGEPVECDQSACGLCDFCEPEIDCEVARKMWLFDEAEKKEYKYYVTCMTDGTVEGIYADCEKPLNSMESLEGLKDKLKDFTGFENVCILNWIELEA